MLAFVALAVVSLTWVEFWPQATRQLRVVILEPAAFYFMIRLMRLERRDLLWLADTLLFTGVAIAVVGLVRYFTGESVVEAENGARRLISVYGSPNGVGLYLGRCLPFALAFVLMSQRGSWRWLYGADQRRGDAGGGAAQPEPGRDPVGTSGGAGRDAADVARAAGGCSR